MPRKCSVPSLGDMSLSNLANLLVSSIGYFAADHPDHDVADEAIIMVEIQEYLEKCGATSNIYEDLLRVILSSDILEAPIRFTCLQMLLNSSVQMLVTDIFPFSYYENILQIIAVQGTGLRTLNLKGIWIKEENMFYLYSIIKKCFHLTRLYIPYVANDDVLHVVSRYCTKLKLLDISGETDITDIGIDYLSQGMCASLLTTIDLGMPGEENICHTDVATLLENCVNIETISTYCYVGRSIKHIVEKGNRDFKSNLKYLHDTKTDEFTLECVVNCCPHLESIYLDSPHKGILHKLKKSLVRKLKIYRFQSEEFLDLVNYIGNHLAYVTLIKGAGSLEIGMLARRCSSLIELELYMMEGLTYVYQRSFTCLQGLEMLNSYMIGSSLRDFICNSLTLKRLAIDSVNFTNEEITAMFIERDFYELEDIWFTRAPHLTVAAVEVNEVFILF